MDRHGTNTIANLCWEGGGTVSPAKPRREGVAKTGLCRAPHNPWGFCWDGELRDRSRSGRARTGEGSPDSSPPNKTTVLPAEG